jgi:formate dehydrogenase alpha subunit
MIGRTSSTTPAESVLEADVILLVNSDPEETHPSFGWRIREAIRKGARLIIINSNRISLHSKASLWIQPRRGTLTHVLSGLMNEILAKKKQDASFIRDETEHFEEFRKFIREITPDVASQVAGVSENAITAAARLLTGEKGLHAIAIYDMENSLDRAHGDLEALTNLLLMTGNMGKKGSGLLLLEKYCNSRGLYDMGAEPGYLPGGYKDTDEDARERLEELWGIHLPDPGAVSGRNVFELLSNNLRGAIIFGENPLEDPAMAKYFRNLEFLAVCDLFSTETSANADIVLPASTYIESGGSFTRFDGKIQHFITITSPPSERTILQIINDLAVTLGKKLDLETKEKAYLEIKKAIPLYKNNERRFSGQFETSGGKARFAAYTLQNTPCSSYGYELDEITRRFTEESRHALKEKKALKTPKKSAKK